MKKLKKMVAVLLTVVMAMAMGVTVFAADAKGNLTVNVKSGEGVPTQTLKGQTIRLYKLFDLTVSATDGNTAHYGYTVNDKYKTALQTALKLGSSATEDDYYTAVRNLGSDNSTGVQNFANTFTNTLLNNKNTSADQEYKVTTDVASYKFTGLDYGYYLVYQTGTKAIQSSLVTIAKADTNINLKSEAPSITKTANVESVKIGQTVTYTITGTIPDPTGYTGYIYKIHDKLTDGLDFVADSAKVKIDNGNEQNVAMTTEDGNNRHIVMDLSSYVTDENKGKTFTLTYQATVNENAVVQTNNQATLEYSNAPSNTSETTTTPPSEVPTPTYPLNIKKIATDAPRDALAGAHFILYSDKNMTEQNIVKVVGSNGSYTVAKSEDTDAISEFVSTGTLTNGYNLHVNGLAAGTYYLKETKAPDGYNKIANAITIKIENSKEKTDINKWVLTSNGQEATDHIVTVENSTGTILPSTGGTGTIIFSIVAGVLILGVAASFIKDRKKAA